MSYEALLIESEELGLKVKEIDLITKDGYCKGNRIAISKRLLTDAEKKCILAEEIAHSRLTVGDITDQKKIENRKQEIVARRWGYEKLIGIIDIINAFNKGINNGYDLAEHFGVTEEFLSETIDYYRAKYGVYYEIDNYFICFEPNLNIIKRF